MSSKRMVMLAGRGTSTAMIFHALNQEFGVEKVILEEGVPLRVFLARRLKNLGVLTVIGQMLFKIKVVPVLRLLSKRRLAEINQRYGLNPGSIPDEKVLSVHSANDKQTIAYLKELCPDIVVINGTRILSQRVLESVPAVFVNMHAGITPLYRGVHGAYWALVQNKPDVCGVTVHVVDPGIDTGGILAQAVVELTSQDNFVTYPFLQLAAGIPLLKKALHDLMEGPPVFRPNPQGESALWSHPTLWGYVWNWLRRGVK